MVSMIVKVWIASQQAATGLVRFQRARAGGLSLRDLMQASSSVLFLFLLMQYYTYVFPCSRLFVALLGN